MGNLYKVGKEIGNKINGLDNTQLELNQVIAKNRDFGETTKPIKVKNLPKGFNSDQWLLAEAMDGLVKYANKMEKAGTPIDYWQYANKILDEMSVISTKHYSDYFLGVQEYINWANSTNPDTGLPYCVTGAGRGSACASLVLFLIGITHNIDPIKYNLMFSRFLTMDRNEPPDWKVVA